MRHGERVLRADVGAGAAALAVHDVDLDAVTQALERLGFLRGARRGSGLLLGEEEGTDGRVRADEGALVAADALIDIPDGDVVGHAALFILRGGGGHDAVGIVDVGADGDVVALGGVGRDEDLLDVFGQALVDDLHLVLEILPRGIDGDLHHGGEALLDGLIVHLDDLLTLLGEGLEGGFLHVLLGLIDREHAGELEEGGLQDGAGAVAQADLLGDVGGVDGVELDAALGQDALGAVREVLCDLLALPAAVEQEGAAGLDLVDHVKAVDIALLVAGEEVRHRDVIGAADRLVTEAQVAAGDAAGFLGVILEVGLHILVGVVADDLAGVLVRADGAVRAETPELAGDDGLAGGDDVLAHGQGAEGDVVVDADGEVVLLLAEHVVEHGLHLRGGDVLGGQTVAAAEDLGVAVRLGKGGADVQIERLADGAGLLGAVEDADALDRLGDGGEEMLDGERTIEVHLHGADLLAALVEIGDDLLQRLADGAHRDDDALGVGRAIVVEELIVAAGEGVDLRHLRLDDAGERIVDRVAGLAVLEEGVVILAGVADGGMLRVQRAGAETVDGLPVDELLEIVIVQNLDLLDLMAGAEAVEEVLHGDAAGNGGQMRRCAEVHGLLHAGGRELRPAGLTAGHDVLMIAEDGDAVRADGTGGDVHDGGQKQAGDAVHRRDHEHKALRGGVGRGERAGLERTLHGGAGGKLCLHFHELDGAAEDVLLAVCGPLVGVVGHRA